MKEYSMDALMHKLQDENEKYKLAHRASISEISLLMKEKKELKNKVNFKEMTLEQVRATRDRHKEEVDKIKKEMKWFENFAGAMYKLDKEMYDKASKVAYEMLKIKEKE